MVSPTVSDIGHRRFCCDKIIAGVMNGVRKVYYHAFGIRSWVFGGRSFFVLGTPQALEQWILRRLSASGTFSRASSLSFPSR